MNQQIIDKNKEIQITKIYNAIRKLSQSEDAHWVETPASLVDEMISNINLDGKILVLFNVDIMLLLLKIYEVPASDIVFLSDDSVKDYLCDKKLGVKYINSIKELKEMNMKFDVVIGNPPYSLAGSKTGKKGRAKNLYPEFYKISIEIADHVYMIVPNTSRQNYGSFNSFIRKHTNKIIPIEDGVFDVNISTWCLIKDGSGTNVNDIDWADLHELPDQKVKWAKGKVNVTTESDLLEDIGGDYTVFHKINGKGLHQSTTQSVPKKKLFPSHGYAVIMPQQIQNHGWTDTAIVKCNGRQAATNGVNLAFVETIKEAEYLVEYMKSPNFVSQALSFCGGMRNMTLSAMRKINMDDYRY